MNLDPNGAGLPLDDAGRRRLRAGRHQSEREDAGHQRVHGVSRAGADAEPGAARQRHLLADLQPAPPGEHQAACTRPTTSRFAAPIPGPTASCGTADDPGTFVTYYDYAPEFAGVRNQTPTLINDNNANQSFKSAEFAVSRRMANRWQVGRVLLVHQEAHSVHRQRRHVGRADLLYRTPTIPTPRSTTPITRRSGWDEHRGRTCFPMASPFRPITRIRAGIRSGARSSSREADRFRPSRCRPRNWARSIGCRTSPCSTSASRNHSR